MERLIRVLVILAASGTMLTACEGPAGLDGVDGANGANGADGTNGTNGSAGTDGTNGTDGTDGTSGTDGENYYGPIADLSVDITSVDGSSPPVVTFEVTDQDGHPFAGFTAETLTSRSMRFAIAKLVPPADGSGDSADWQSYLNNEEDTSGSDAGPGGVPALASAIQATYEYKGTIDYLGNGEYTYTFATDIAAVTDPLEVAYDEDVLHRVGMQLAYDNGTEDLIYNITYDWVPSGADAPVTRDMVTVDSCNECHDKLAIHGGGRIDTAYCVMCHNPGSTDANSGNTVDMTVMIHKIHMGESLPSVEDGDPYVIYGHNDSAADYSHVGYPQPRENCIKCHDPDDAETPDAVNYLDVPTMNACGACHDAIDWSSGDNHDGGAQSDNGACTLCHSADAIGEYHLVENLTAHNPDLPDGVWDITYELVSASVDADNVLSVDFMIYADGEPLDTTALPEDLTSGGRYPSLLLAYAMPQDGIDEPADWNNLGNNEAQPESVGIGDVVAGEEPGASMSYSDGVNTLTMADAFPEGATLRAVAIQSYFYQYVDDVRWSRHAKSVIVGVEGDVERRTIVDSDKCASCHEWFEGHGGNRVYQVEVCAMCHNQNLSSSGREIDIDYPEASNNIKDLIHAIHGASQREEPIEFVRNRSGGTYYAFISHDMLEDYPDGHVVAYPANPANCTMCHEDGTYLPEEIPAAALPSNWLMADDAQSTDDVVTIRSTVPNDGDLITTPGAAACASCHDSSLAEAHMEQNGSMLFWPRADVTAEQPFETCALCHGEGRTADVKVMHGID